MITNLYGQKVWIFYLYINIANNNILIKFSILLHIGQSYEEAYKSYATMTEHQSWILKAQEFEKLQRNFYDSNECNISCKESEEQRILKEHPLSKEYAACTADHWDEENNLGDMPEAEFMDLLRQEYVEGSEMVDLLFNQAPISSELKASSKFSATHNKGIPIRKETLTNYNDLESYYKGLQDPRVARVDEFQGTSTFLMLNETVETKVTLFLIIVMLSNMNNLIFISYAVEN